MPAGVRGRWVAIAWAVPTAIVAVAAIVLVARWAREQPGVIDFLAANPGHATLPNDAPVGFPAWLGWQHFLNAFFIVLIIRSGLLVRRTTRPGAFWTRNTTGLIRTKGLPKRISLDLWFHLSLDALWVLNGIVFIVMLLVSGHWMRIVPTTWDVVPNAVSAALQYASLDWPTENGWVNYNALQLLAYFGTVFIASPLAIVTGLRMSPAWPHKVRLNALYPIGVARAVHFPVMFYFVVFIVAHIGLVLATGALRNLNHMYGARDEVSWFGFWVFVASIIVIVAAWIAARPLILRSIASLFGKVSR